MVFGLREVVRARCADQAREVGHSRVTRVGIFECKCVLEFHGGISLGRGRCSGSLRRGSGWTRCELGDMAMIVIVRGGVDVVQPGVQRAISDCRGSLFVAARYRGRESRSAIRRPPVAPRSGRTTHGRLRGRNSASASGSDGLRASTPAAVRSRVEIVASRATERQPVRTGVGCRVRGRLRRPAR